jgi:putative addiction module component (TIGR02574 family)
MGRTREQVLQDALALTVEERLGLSQDLYASTMTAEERELEEAWIVEAERRYADWKAGRTKTIPGEEVFRELREKYAGRSVRVRR